MERLQRRFAGYYEQNEQYQLRYFTITDSFLVFSIVRDLLDQPLPSGKGIAVARFRRVVHHPRFCDWLEGHNSIWPKRKRSMGPNV
jgi:hypothetical protein